MSILAFIEHRKLGSSTEMSVLNFYFLLIIITIIIMIIIHSLYSTTLLKDPAALYKMVI